jgi:membrane protein DedA with SNARE-associated domain
VRGAARRSTATGDRRLGVHALATTSLVSNWWAYTGLFLAVAASWAGVPFVGATALTAAGVAASQGTLDLALVVAVATAAGEVGGLIGYAVGHRWGRQLLERPGKHQAGRQRMVERGERAYARWGRLAVFFTPAIVSGTAKMQHGQFVLWNLMASLAFALSVAASTFGLGKLFTGSYSLHDIGTLVIGLGVGALITVFYVRHRHRSASKAAQD